MAIYPVILSGGSGTRLWPLSRTAMPKQLLALTSELSLLQETVLRAAATSGIASPVLVCNEEHRFLIAEQLRVIGIKPHAIFLEPVGRNTAPAVTLAALALATADPDAILLVLPSDHIIGNATAMHRATVAAISAAQHGNIVAFGIAPTAPVTGYGYIQRGVPLQVADGIFRIARFVEKPSTEFAQAYIESKEYYWNSGMFVFSAATFLNEINRLQPAIFASCTQALERARADLEFTRLDPRAFAACPSLSLDYALMEHTKLGAVAPVNIEWSDVGSWQALWEVQEKDVQGNVLSGDVISENVSNSLINAQSRMVAALGVRDLVIVETSDAVLVAHKDQAQNVKLLVDRLQAANRTERVSHRRVYRPWGYYESVDAGERFQVKRLMVKPGARLSLQMHHHRAEHWVVVTGTAKVTRGDTVTLLGENQSTYIPLGVLHRLENSGKVPLYLIEVQSGGYLGEDDIVRLEDSYNRIDAA
jgi:mannose-1-phosphate guanylyltransferase / mannose-6-phosphate isomerase